MNYQAIFRYTILVVSSLAMIVGILVMAGMLVPRNFPDQYSLLVGVVVFLYGAYRFTIAYFKKAS